MGVFFSNPFIRNEIHIVDETVLHGMPHFFRIHAHLTPQGFIFTITSCVINVKRENK